MKKIALVSLAALALPTVAFAQDSSVLPGEFSANVGFVSDYTFRGISQTDEAAAIQGGIDWSHDSGFHFGVWGSNVDFNEASPIDGASAEIDVYGGWGQSVGAFSYDIGFIYYAYPGADSNLDYDFVEGTLKAGYTIVDGLDVGALYAYSPDFFGGVDEAHYLEGSASYGFDIGLPVTLAAAVGHQWLEGAAIDYLNWSTTASVDIDAFTVGLSYRDTDLSKRQCGGDACDARGVAFVTYSF
ncbi:TorF family putative porin [Novispirillum sp. DQ9]|uniref:TorF family putative porin n=1 Tax=Novispirillum sp. DQ9 TaxID=3398612 RepID=UPI003C7AB284